MEENADIREYWKIIKRRRLQFIVPSLLVFSIATLISFVLPSVYKSTATILIEAQEIPQDFVRSTVTGYVEERLQTISQIVLSRAKLLEIMKRFGLYEDLKRKYTTEQIVEKMRADIEMEPIQAEVVDPKSGRPGSATIAFTLSYKGKNPRQVSDVCNLLVSFYLEENLRNREEKARATFEFLEEQVAKLRSQILGAEKEIAEFKKKHISHLPELMQLNLQTMEKLQRQMDAKEEQIKGLVNRKIYLEGQLATVEPTKYAFSVDGSRILTPREELKALRNQYISLSATLSAQHPDLIAVNKRLAALETEVNIRADLQERYRELRDKEHQLALASERFSDIHPDVVKLKKEVGGLKEKVRTLSGKQTILKSEDEKPENPAYINLETQITSTQMDIDTAQNELVLLNDKYEDYLTRVENTPYVEQEYVAMQRDYANAQAKYQETMNRLMAAREATSLEAGRKSERFTLIDPPVTPEKPDSPNRIAILLIGVVLATGCGIGCGSLAEYMDRSVRRADELATVAGHPVLAIIPYLVTLEDSARMRRRKWIFAGGAVGLIITGIAALHFLFGPLNILWIKIMRRLYIGV